MKVGLIQHHCVEDRETNIVAAIKKIEEAASKGANVVCLPELFSSLYFCETENYESFSLAEAIPGQTTTRFCEVANRLGVVLIVSLFEKRAPGVYHNTAAVIDADGTYLGKYRKMHIPDDPGYYEKFYFTPGDLGYKVFETKYGKIGVLICWDQWYPEAARITSLMGADLLFFPTAIGWASSQDLQTNKRQYEAWQTIQRSHAIANGVHVVSVNRVGNEKEMQFWGGSFVADPQGALLCLASHEKEEVIVQEVNLKDSDYYRTHWPFLRDRRIDSYEPILQRYIDQSSL